MDHVLAISDYQRIYDGFSNIFPQESFFIVDGEELIKHPATEIKKVEKFLELTDFYRREHFYFHRENGGKFPCFTLPQLRCMGSDKGRHHPKSRRETARYLKQIFQPLMKNFTNKTGVNIIL